MTSDKSMHAHVPRTVGWVAIGVLIGLAVACSSAPNRAPVEDRGRASRVAAPPPAPPAVSASAPLLPNAEFAGKPGYYSVKPGDTIMRISLETGQNWRDIQRWNNLDNANVIEVGQVLRVVAPDTDPAAVAARAVPSGSVETRTLEPRAGGPAPAASGVAAPVVAATTPALPPPAAVAPAKREPDDEIPWMWPAPGPVVRPFDDARNKGLVISGKLGEPVLAAADGRVVYSGSGLRGYGNLVIVKHNNTYLTAYAHNQALMVKEDQVVRRGQKIAEMGSSDADQVQLHFEIRKQGKPVDPAKLLPPR
jgi:lipoprotein NlpD